MKRYNIFFFILITALFFACEDDSPKPTYEAGSGEPSIMITPANGSSFELNKIQGAEPFENFTWTETDYGAALARVYNLECDLAGNNFSDMIILTETGELQYQTTVADFNLILYDMGFMAGVSGDIDLRIKTTVDNPSVDTLYSMKNTISVVTFAYNLPAMLAPTEKSLVLVQDPTGAIDFETFEWAAVDYGDDYAVNYKVEFDAKDSSFVNAVKLYEGSKTEYTPKVADFNEMLINAGYPADIASEIEFRVSSSVDKKGVVISTIETYTITPYSLAGEIPDPVYLLGAATTAEWDNTQALLVEYDEERKVHSITTTLIAGGMKIIKELGAWAPQWGDDGNGDGTGGKLIYRPDEATDDPAEIPSPGEGTFRIDIDIPKLTYTITPA